MKFRRSGPLAPFTAHFGVMMVVPLALLSAASAAPRIKKIVNKEVYAATDRNEMPVDEQPGFAVPAESDPAAAPALALKQTRAPVRAAKPKVPAPAAQPKVVSSAFDSVPASQSEAILQRLKIVENLVRNYGRAYDYRTHTLKELQLIQSTLESTAAAQAPAAAPIPTAPAPAAATQDTDNVNLSSLPAPAEFDPNNADPQDN